MKIEHIAMYVKDLEQMKDFYCHYFNGKANDKYHNPNTGLETYFITFEEGARLELMARPGVTESSEDLWVYGLTHLAMSVGDKEMVDTLTNTLIEAGCEHISGPRTTGDGYYESCVKDPEGNQIEITV
ncbi:VOC family protein [Macrococcus sp. EM39E]|uniref:VOC family protein n=1 Tax=Macrococcus animalis TaxID=3395467 RepID=UPI0039BE2550